MARSCNPLLFSPSSQEAVYFGTSRGWGHGAGAGPWVMVSAGAENSRKCVSALQSCATVCPLSNLARL